MLDRMSGVESENFVIIKVKLLPRSVRREDARNQFFSDFIVFKFPIFHPHKIESFLKYIQHKKLFF
jgi:hypothetical protein